MLSGPLKAALEYFFQQNQYADIQLLLFRNTYMGAFFIFKNLITFEVVHYMPMQSCDNDLMS